MEFCQIIEFATDQIEAFHAELDAWKVRTEGSRIPHRATLCRDRDNQTRYLLKVQFASYERAMENSSRPETGEFAAFLMRLSNGPLGFQNLDVLREEEF